jgi:hypothetical protein
MTKSAASISEMILVSMLSLCSMRSTRCVLTQEGRESFSQHQKWHRCLCEQTPSRRSSAALRAWSARGGRAEVFLNLCERDHHHHRIYRTLVESSTFIEAPRVVGHRMQQHCANASNLSGRDGAE